MEKNSSENLKPKSLESVAEISPEVTFRTLDTISEKILSQMVELEHIAWRHEITAEEMAKWLEGGVVGAIFSGDKMIGDVITRIVADSTKTKEIILNRLPPESLNADGTLIHPDFRGKGLQKILLLSRIDLARKLGKETILSCVRAENGASLRNIINTGARILAYAPNYFPDSENPARLIWENDLTIPTEADERIEKKNTQFPDVVIDVRSGEEVDAEVQKEIAKILSKDYVGINVQTLHKDDVGIPISSAIVFRHLSNFPPELAKRLHERKQKIQEILKPFQEKFDIKTEVADQKDWEAYKELRLLAITGKDKIFFGRSSHPEEIEEEKNRTDQEWQNLLSQKGRFAVLSWEGSKVIGMGIAREREKEKDWWMGAGYVREDSRGRGIGKKIFATRLNEIRNRGGTKVRMGVNADNDRSIHVAELFGFKKVEGSASNIGFEMELEDVNDPEVVRKINEVLNAG